jgi:hypothetical protein
VHEQLARGELGDAQEAAAGRRHVLEGEELPDRRQVRCSGHDAGCEDGGRLGGVQQAAGDLGEVQRLLAQPVAGEHEPLPPHVPKGDGEHPAQALDEVQAPLLVGVGDDLAVGLRREDVPEAPELLPQGLEVVDLAVAGCDDAPIFR